MLLIRQYRHPIRTRDWEIPAGLLDEAGEPPLTPRSASWPRRPTSPPRSGTCSPTSGTRPAAATRRSASTSPASSTVPSVRAHDEEADIEVRWVRLDDAGRRGAGAARAEPVARHRRARRAVASTGAPAGTSAGAHPSGGAAGTRVVRPRRSGRPGSPGCRQRRRRRMTPEAAVAGFLRHVSVERGLAATRSPRTGATSPVRGPPRGGGHRGHGRGRRTARRHRVLAARSRTRGAARAASSVARMLSSVRGLHRFLAEDGCSPPTPRTR